MEIEFMTGRNSAVLGFVQFPISREEHPTHRYHQSDLVIKLPSTISSIIFCPSATNTSLSIPLALSNLSITSFN